MAYGNSGQLGDSRGASTPSVMATIARELDGQAEDLKLLVDVVAELEKRLEPVCCQTRTWAHRQPAATA